MSNKPKLIVFDLDYTLWPFWVDTHVDPPFSLDSSGKVRDTCGRHIKWCPDVPHILSSLTSQGYPLGIASRTGSITDARQLLRLFEWEKYFVDSQIYPDDKCTHFQKIKEKLKIPFTDMLFFDDEERNIESVSTLGVTCILVDDTTGMTKELLAEGLARFSKNNK